jgi:hypothetical protein
VHQQSHDMGGEDESHLAIATYVLVGHLHKLGHVPAGGEMVASETVCLGDKTGVEMTRPHKIRGGVHESQGHANAPHQTRAAASNDHMSSQ